MPTIRQQARTAGLLYLLMLTGLAGLVIIPGRLVVSGNPAATAEHIRASETLLRIGIASELFSQVVFIYVALALYRLFESVDRNAALQLVALVLVSVPIVFITVLSEIAALVVAGGPPYLVAFTQPQLDAVVYSLMHLRGAGYGVAQVFWSLWLVPFGWLVIRSGFLPKPLGVLLLFGAAGQMIRVVTNLFPGPYTTVAEPIGRILSLGELPIILWLVIWGSMRGPRAEPERAAAS